MVTQREPGQSAAMANDLAARQDAVARHPSSRNLPTARRDELVWRQLSLFVDEGYEHGREHVIRHPQTEQLARVRQLRRQLQSA